MHDLEISTGRIVAERPQYVFAGARARVFGLLFVAWASIGGASPDPAPDPKSAPALSSEPPSIRPIVVLGTATSTASAAATAAPTAPKSTVLVVPIRGTIDLGLAPFVDRMLDEHPDVVAVVLDINTFGGRIDAAVRIRDRLLALDIPTVAFVDRRAISAGALIALATDQIVFAPGASMGAATPVQIEEGTAKPVEEKVVSYMRSEMRATAEAKGRRADIAEAMVDAEIAIDGITAKGSLLTVTTEEALRLHLAAGKADDIGGLLKALGLDRAEVVRGEENWAENFATFITSPVVAGALMSIGLLALGIELYSPGIGFAGALGVVFLSLFFGGHMVVHLAGAEEIILFLVGIALLAVEIFVIPGFGITGVLGILAVATSLVMALIGMPLGVSWNTGVFSDALRQVLYSLLVTIVLMSVVVRFLPQSRFMRRFILSDSVGRQSPELLAELDDGPIQVGAVGVTITDLRPSGKMDLAGRTFDVVSEHEYIPKGVEVRVLRSTGMSVVVTRRT
ncbi:MAG: nodulation protein NfeD [Deltaproteobacteria bacterium]|nr:nodulation protein NfeD [Deltaproteobacteria bacterium]